MRPFQAGLQQVCCRKFPKLPKLGFFSETFLQNIQINRKLSQKTPHAQKTHTHTHTKTRTNTKNDQQHNKTQTNQTTKTTNNKKHPSPYLEGLWTMVSDVLLVLLLWAIVLNFLLLCFWFSCRLFFEFSSVLQEFLQSFTSFIVPCGRAAQSLRKKKL